MSGKNCYYNTANVNIAYSSYRHLYIEEGILYYQKSKS